jgi:hypothetical protein
MANIVVKDNVRYRKRDAEREDIVAAVRTNVPVESAASVEAEKARAELQAELDETRRVDEKSDEAATKVKEPETTKVREPETVKRGRQAPAAK